MYCSKLAKENEQNINLYGINLTYYFKIANILIP